LGLRHGNSARPRRGDAAAPRRNGPHGPRPMSEAPLDRRPIAARNLKVMQAIASWMARRGFSANGISVAGMAFGTLAGVALFLTSRSPDFARPLWVAGAVFIQLRLLANLF